MDRKVAGIGIGAILAISLFAMMGLAFAQDSADTKGENFVDEDDDGVCDNAQDCEGFEDADNDGVCDHAGDCPMHEKKGGCHGSGGCPRMQQAAEGGCPYHSS